MSDREILRSSAPDYSDDTVIGEEPSVTDLGSTEESIIAAMNAVFRDLSTGRISKDTADPQISAARVTLNAIKSRDAKQKIALLEKMLQQARAVAEAGIRRESEDRLHVTKPDREPEPEGDSEPDPDEPDPSEPDGDKGDGD